MTRNDYLQKAALVKHGYILKKNLGVGLFMAESLNNCADVEHGFTARTGGKSPKPFDSLNLGFLREENDENVIENYKIFASAAGLNYNEFVLVNFEHGVNVECVTKSDALKGLEGETLPPCDAIVTNEKGITLITNHADCGVFFLFDPVKKVVGIAHAGWKGMLGRIGAKTVEKMQSEYGCNAADIIASNGPCICGNCYEVDEELAKKFENEFLFDGCSKPIAPGKRLLNLETAAFIQLLDAGLLPENITLMDLCTFENSKWFYSYRRDGKNSGDMAAYIKLV